MFKNFKEIYNKNLKLRFKKKHIPHYIPNKTLIRLYKYNTSKYSIWKFHKIVPWSTKYLKANWNWRDIEIAKNIEYIHPITGKFIKTISSYRKRWYKVKPLIKKNNRHNVRYVHNYINYKLIYNTYIKKLNKHTFHREVIEELDNNINNIFLYSLFKPIPFYDNLKNIDKIKIYYSFRYIGHFILNKDLNILKYNINNIYSIRFPHLISYIINYNPKWIYIYPTSNIIISDRIKNTHIYNPPIYIDNYIYSIKWLKTNNFIMNNISYILPTYSKIFSNIKYFNHYIPLWKNNLINIPYIKPTNKKNYLKLSKEFYIKKNINTSYKELYILIEYLIINPYNTKKILKIIKKSKCINNIKNEYFLEIFGNIKPQYTSIWQHYNPYHGHLNPKNKEADKFIYSLWRGCLQKRWVKHKYTVISM